MVRDGGKGAEQKPAGPECQNPLVSRFDACELQARVYPALGRRVNRLLHPNSYPTRKLAGTGGETS